MGWIIGKRGTYINQLSQKSGATITISDSTSKEYGTVWKYVQITGSGRAVDRAKKLLHIRLERLEPRAMTADGDDDVEEEGKSPRDDEGAVSEDLSSSKFPNELRTGAGFTVPEVGDFHSGVTDLVITGAVVPTSDSFPYRSHSQSSTEYAGGGSLDYSADVDRSFKFLVPNSAATVSQAHGREDSTQEECDEDNG